MTLRNIGGRWLRTTGGIYVPHPCPSVFARAGETATILRPTRAGASDQYLEVGGVQTTDTGSPLYTYDGTGGSPALVRDPKGSAGVALVQGDTVGVPFVWDSVGQRTRGTTYGTPYSVRDTASDGSGAQFSLTDYYTITPAGTESGWSVAFKCVTPSIPATSSYSPLNRLTTGGFYITYTGAGDWQSQVQTDAGSPGGVMKQAVATGVEVWLVLSVASSSCTFRVYNASTGGFLGGGSDSFTDGAITTLKPYYVGRGSVHGFPGTSLLAQFFDATLNAVNMATVGAGLGHTLGSYAYQIGGNRTGVYLPASPGTLYEIGGSGGAVTLQPQAA